MYGNTKLALMQLLPTLCVCKKSIWLFAPPKYNILKNHQTNHTFLTVENNISLTEKIIAILMYTKCVYFIYIGRSDINA